MLGSPPLLTATDQTTDIRYITLSRRMVAASAAGMERLDLLRGEEKHYTFSTNGETFSHIPFETPPQLPAGLEPGWRQRFRLPMCAEPDGAGLELVVQVVVSADDRVACMPVMVNGCWPKLEHERTVKLLFPCGLYTHHVAASGPSGPEAQRRQANVGYNYTFPVSLVKEGWNEIVVENGSERQIRIVCIELAIRQRRPA